MKTETSSTEKTIAEINAALAPFALAIDETILQRDDGVTAPIKVLPDETPTGRQKLTISVRDHERSFTARKSGFELDLIVGWIRTTFDLDVAKRTEANAKAKRYEQSAALAAKLTAQIGDAPIMVHGSTEHADRVMVHVSNVIELSPPQVSALVHLLIEAGAYKPKAPDTTIGSEPRFEAYDQQLAVMLAAE